MTDFTEDDKHILMAIKELARQKKSVTLEGIRDYEGWSAWKKDLPALVVALDRLVEHGLITGVEKFSLTEQGLVMAKESEGEGFGKWMIACEQSGAYRKFCQKVFRADRCQFDMLTQNQFEKLLEVLDCCAEDQVLDLGCGTGSIAENISDLTGAHVLGIDFSAEAIRFAQGRTPGKSERLSFQKMDMDNLDFPPKCFDVVVSVDTLYFVSDLCHTLGALKKCLRDTGRMGIFFTAHPPEGEPQEKLSPERTSLAKALYDYDLSFKTWDFTADEKGVWERSLEAAQELKQEFEAEGNSGIIEDRVFEAKKALEYFDTGRTVRYLYLVWVSRTE